MLIHVCAPPREHFAVSSRHSGQLPRLPSSRSPACDPLVVQPDHSRVEGAVSLFLSHCPYSWAAWRMSARIMRPWSSRLSLRSCSKRLPFLPVPVPDLRPAINRSII